MACRAIFCLLVGVEKTAVLEGIWPVDTTGGDFANPYAFDDC
jgi:hypothetical protein